MPETDDILSPLNPAQLEAVTATEGYVRVIAGAGSGKTRALAHRFAHLVNNLGIMPQNILCVTFTTKAASEMKRRIRRLTGDSSTGYISTFHSFCVSVLQEDGHAVAYPKNFLVLDNADIDAMLKIIYEERGLTLRHMTFSNARDMIEIRKLFREPEYYLDMVAMPLEQLREKYNAAAAADDIIFYGYLYQEKKCFALDYNDLLKFSLYIFAEHPEIRRKWQERLAYIMIDEFQDIDAPQYELMQVLCAYHQNLFVVGDPDQTVYTWRGANIRYLLDFPTAFPSTRTIMMMDNYRSTPEIIAAANSLIAKNAARMKKDLRPAKTGGTAVLYHHAPTAEAEALWIAGKIRELENAGTKLSDIAVLYRAHHVTRTLEEVFMMQQLPYTLFSGVQFFARAEIKDALAYLRLLVLRDDLAFRRVANVPKRNLGERRMKFLENTAAAEQCSLYAALLRSLDDPLFKNTGARRLASLVERYAAGVGEMSISELLAAVLDESGYETALRTEGSQERLDNLAELKQSVHEYETACGEECTLENYLAHIALFSNADAAGEREAVKLLTVHAAKGLEFPWVFLCSMEEGIFPAKKTATPEMMEEERRLAFVAVTRAEEGLFISDAEGKNFDGSYRYPSRFIFDIGEKFLTYTAPLNEKFVGAAMGNIAGIDRRLRPAAAAAELYAPGTRIVHRFFGAGTITETIAAENAYLIQFDNLPTPRRLSAAALLALEKTLPPQ